MINTNNGLLIKEKEIICDWKTIIQNGIIKVVTVRLDCFREISVWLYPKSIMKYCGMKN